MKKVNFSGRFGSCLGEDLVVGGVRKCVEMRGGQASKSSPLRAQLIAECTTLS